LNHLIAAVIHTRRCGATAVFRYSFLGLCFGFAPHVKPARKSRYTLDELLSG
jgi:hypothetical protein